MSSALAALALPPGVEERLPGGHSCQACLALILLVQRISMCYKKQRVHCMLHADGHLDLVWSAPGIHVLYSGDELL